ALRLPRGSGLLDPALGLGGLARLAVQLACLVIQPALPEVEASVGGRGSDRERGNNERDEPEPDEEGVVKVGDKVVFDCLGKQDRHLDELGTTVDPAPSKVVAREVMLVAPQVVTQRKAAVALLWGQPSGRRRPGTEPGGR